MAWRGIAVSESVGNVTNLNFQQRFDPKSYLTDPDQPGNSLMLCALKVYPYPMVAKPLRPPLSSLPVN